MNHAYVGTEHLLLGLIELGQGVAVNVLKRMGLFGRDLTELAKKGDLDPVIGRKNEIERLIRT